MAESREPMPTSSFLDKTMDLKCQIIDEIKHRYPYYRKDWKDAARYATILIAPTIYVFLNSLIPALAFGQQIYDNTGGTFGISHVLTVTAIGGITQALFGGQPMLIVGLAEPIVVMYGFMYELAVNNSDIGHDLFRPWCAWVCIWVSAFCTLYSALGITRLIRYFTRFCGHSFGCLIIILFMQQAIVGTVNEFKHYGATNGMWSLVVVLNLPLCALALTQLRNTYWFPKTIRNILSDYAAPLVVLLWTALSAALPASGLHGLPHHVDSTQPWEDSKWAIGMIKGMTSLPVSARLLAAGPGLMISILFFFDHTVSSQLAQTGDDIAVNRPPTYAYDLMLLAVITAGLGLFGMPPINGVIPQAPLHARAMKGLKYRAKEKQLADGRVRTPDDDIRNRESEAEDVALRIHDVRPQPVRLRLVDENDETYQTNQQKMTVLEQRGSNFVQALLCGCLVPAAPITGLLPTSVLWGYFAFMALDAARSDNDLIHRLLLFFRDKQYGTPREGETIDEAHPVLGGDNSMWNTSYARVPIDVVYLYTIIQLGMVLGIWLLIYFGSTVVWGGILFPLPIVALLAIRAFVLPKIFSHEYLEALDPSAPVEDNENHQQQQPQPTQSSPQRNAPNQKVDER